MALHPSGSPLEEIELVQIETADFSFVIKGRAHHPRYEGLKAYRSMDFHDEMNFSFMGKDVESVNVFDVEQQKLVSQKDHQLRPIFFEQTTYQFLIIPKEGKELEFYHEHHLFRQAVSEITIGSQSLLMGQINFGSEIGFSTFEIHSNNEPLLTVMIEVFPAKLDYKNDYKKLLDEVNDEIYNLAYHFLRRTHLHAKIKLDGQPTLAEFYRLFVYHFESFIKTVTRIEQQPHHKLQKKYEWVRADKVKRLDSYGRKQLRKSARLFVEHERGIGVGDQKLLPTRGLNNQKQVVYNTDENQYIKWLIERLIEKLESLVKQLAGNRSSQTIDPYLDVQEKVQRMIRELKQKRASTFWQEIKAAPMAQFSTVLQMAAGYRDALQIYLTVSKGLSLFGHNYQMSVKNVAELYEYWTFLKIGRILKNRYTQVSQDIVSVNTNGLHLNLDANRRAKRVFEHPITHEKISLTYQKRETNPTTVQLPDVVLSIDKKGKDGPFNYVFDAKYRIDFALDDTYYGRRYNSPGPLEEDINTMHRYRDAIVHKKNGPYEKTAFGAYVLFPFGFEEGYRNHHFYKSIGDVNIGGLPFLPSATKLVEEVIDNLIEKSDDELQEEGILPQGSKQKWRSELEEYVLVSNIETYENYAESVRRARLTIPLQKLNKHWRKAKYIALYVSKRVKETNGVVRYGEICDISIQNNSVSFDIDSWRTIDPIKPVQYGVAHTTMTTFSQLQDAKELPELFMKTEEETVVWKLLRRVSDRVGIELQEKKLEDNERIDKFVVKDIEVTIEQDKVLFQRGTTSKSFNIEELDTSLFRVFRELVLMMEE
ncbi:DUF2357 domain-containing protein [Geomicrobium sp. JSM 1781026]|uniref:DUF2357 domain-containing protein n=1 Tax=Geomicrobium sp. JSM 1781026 TaxID=3344580 RepID=UPI0035BF3323